MRMLGGVLGNYTHVWVGVLARVVHTCLCVRLKPPVVEFGALSDGVSIGDLVCNIEVCNIASKVGESV